MRTITAVLLSGIMLAACAREEEAEPLTLAIASTDPMDATGAERRPTTVAVVATATTLESGPAPSTTVPGPTIRPRSTWSTSSTTSTTTTTLPVPIPPPPEDGHRDPEMVLGRIEIPAIELDSELQEGIRIPTLDDGPGHWPGTAMPGELGNVVVAGHRTSAGAEFRRMDDLVAGDEVIMTTPHGRFVYHVERIEIVGPDALWIVDQTAEHRATLFACHPPGSVAERIVAHLRLADA